MVYYVKKGKVPEQRHTYDDRSHIFKEELFGLKAFDGKLYSQNNLKNIYFSFSELLERASESVPLLPGDVIGSGTFGTGCILELGPEAPVIHCYETEYGIHAFFMAVNRPVAYDSSNFHFIVKGLAFFRIFNFISRWVNIGCA